MKKTHYSALKWTRCRELQHSQNGFTLLELLVALAIFSIIAVMAYSGLNAVLNAREQTTQQADELAKLQMAIHLISRDVQQFVNRPIRNEFGELQPALQGQLNQLAFTHAGWRNPTQQKRSQLRRVNYFIEDKQLWYRYWSVLDRAQDSQPYQVKLLDNVEQMQLQFLDEDDKWLSTWVISPQSATQDKRLKLIPPHAVELVLVTQRWGAIRRLFALIELPVYSTPKPEDGKQQNGEIRELKPTQENIN
ncbi:type II secretion system minor pseudopilin GspJ [Candidatus Albibeggiatoa sp. nov. BB20]|uniref:type II secretion system minor pseudopilin GspJ n=1 Tax=Candidatus Albibeggiatoa sp. nov. BB20 TaxID=3162723 RepID=UPI0033655BC5